MTPNIILRENKLFGAFDKATDCLCPFSVRRWDGNSDVDEKTFQLFEFRIDDTTLRRSPAKYL